MRFPCGSVPLEDGIPHTLDPSAVGPIRSLPLQRSRHAPCSRSWDTPSTDDLGPMSLPLSHTPLPPTSSWRDDGSPIGSPDPAAVGFASGVPPPGGEGSDSECMGYRKSLPGDGCHPPFTGLPRLMCHATKYRL
jgi:hypothetical protein